MKSTLQKANKTKAEPFPRKLARNPQALGSFLSVSKGIDIYGFLDPIFGTSKGVTLQFTVPGNTTSFANTASYQGLQPPTVPNGIVAPQGMQVDSSEIGFWDYTGNFSWSAIDAFEPSTPLVEGSVAISPYSGNSEGTVTDMFNTPSSIIAVGTVQNTSHISVSYGFYDSGLGYAGLPNQDQFYLYVAQSAQTWMTGAASAIGSVPLSQLCLPGAHDAGMCTMQSVYTMMDSVEGYAFEALVAVLVTALTSDIVGPVSPLLGAYAAANAINAIRNFSITQKDSITGMLNSGIRYFDFRPGYMYSWLPSLGGALYHQHMMIPGYGYVNFLQDILAFCSANPGEIVVISLCDDGFSDKAEMSPTDGDLQTAWLSACAGATNVSGQTGVYNIAPVGGPTALSATCNALLQGTINNAVNTGSTVPITSNQVVFLYDMTNAHDYTAVKWDSYSDPVYATLDPTPIRAAMEGMSTATSTGDYTVLQCQGTCTNLGPIRVASCLINSPGGSPLLSTKAAFDSCNLGWLWTNGSTFSSSQLLAVLNDFADNATVTTALAINNKRIQNFPLP